MILSFLIGYIYIHIHIHLLPSSVIYRVTETENRKNNIIYNMEAIQEWVSQHKLTSIGALWASGIGASLAYTRARTPLKPSLRLIHARMHAQALTLAVLSGAAVYHYYEKKAAGDRPQAPASALPVPAK